MGSERLNFNETYKDLDNTTTGKTLTHYLASDTEFKDILLKRGINLNFSKEDIQRIYSENHKKWLKELKERDVAKEETKDAEAINRNVSPEFLEQNERRREESKKLYSKPGVLYEEKLDSSGRFTGFRISTPISAMSEILIQNIRKLTLQDFRNFGKNLLSTGLYIGDTLFNSVLLSTATCLSLDNLVNVTRAIYDTGTVTSISTILNLTKES